MTIAVADSWEARSTTATVNVTIPADTVVIGDLLVVVTFCAGSGSADGAVTDDAGNTYTSWMETPAGGAYTFTVGIADTYVAAVPTQVTVVNSAGGANDSAAVAMRITHDGTGWLDKSSVDVETSTLDDPTSQVTSVGDVSSADSFAGPGSALFIAALTHDGATTTLAPQATWTEVEEDEDASTGVPYSVVSKVYTEQPGTITHQWTTGAARDYSMIILGYTENISELTTTTVATAPSPAVTGLTVELDTTNPFPDPSDYTFHALIGPPDAVPDMFNAEMVRVIGRSGTTWDIERGQAGTRAHAIEVGWIVWFDHIYQDRLPSLIIEAASVQLKDATSTIPWP